jgi:hypothetical protein
VRNFTVVRLPKPAFEVVGEANIEMLRLLDGLNDVTLLHGSH